MASNPWDSTLPILGSLSTLHCWLCDQLVWNLLSSCSASSLLGVLSSEIPSANPCEIPIPALLCSRAIGQSHRHRWRTVHRHLPHRNVSGDTPSYSADFQVDHKDRFLYKWFNSLNSLTFPSFFLYMVCVFSTFRAVITLEKSSPSAMWHRDRGWVWLRMPRKIPKMVCQFLATTSTIYINLLCGVNCCKNKTCDLNRQTDLFWKITSSFARNCTRGWHWNYPLVN